MLCIERRTVWLRDLNIMKIGVEVFGVLRNVELEENDKMTREVTNEQVLESIRREKDRPTAK